MPPPMVICMPSSTICLAAVAIAIRPDEHCRSIVMPGTVTGKPARSSGLARDVAAGRALLQWRSP